MLLDMDMDDDDRGVEQEKLEPTVMVCDTCDRCEGGRVGGDGKNVSLWRCLRRSSRRYKTIIPYRRHLGVPRRDDLLCLAELEVEKIQVNSSKAVRAHKAQRKFGKETPTPV